MSTTVILIILFIAIIIFSAWNGYTLNQIKKSSHTRAELNDAKYWELKSKQEYLIAVVTLIVAVVAYLGFNTKKDIENELKAALKTKLDTAQHQIKTQLDSATKDIYVQLRPINSTVEKFQSSLNAAEKNINETDLKITNYKTAINALIGQQKGIENKAFKSEGQVNALVERIDILNKSNILKLPIYVVKDYKYGFHTYDTVYFSNLRTVVGDRLPTFKKPPVIVPISVMPIVPLRITTTSFLIHGVGNNSIAAQDLIDKKYAGITFMIYEVP